MGWVVSASLDKSGGPGQVQPSTLLPTVIKPEWTGKRTEIISISFPFGGVIEGHSAVFRGLVRRRGIARETPENLDSTTGGPNGIRTRGYGPPRASCFASRS
jgi:hypothetical protein